MTLVCWTRFAVGIPWSTTRPCDQNIKWHLEHGRGDEECHSRRWPHGRSSAGSATVVAVVRSGIELVTIACRPGRCRRHMFRPLRRGWGVVLRDRGPTSVARRGAHVGAILLMAHAGSSRRMRTIRRRRPYGSHPCKGQPQSTACLFQQGSSGRFGLSANIIAGGFCLSVHNAAGSGRRCSGIHPGLISG